MFCSPTQPHKNPWNQKRSSKNMHVPRPKAQIKIETAVTPGSMTMYGIEPSLMFWLL
jgi:hypothetical protein